MTDYTKSTNFATKDSLPPGSALKIVRGTEIDTEFNAIATAVATKFDSSATLPVANGGTGATTASVARTNLGVAIGTNVQAWDADLDTWATKTAPSGTVVGTSDTQTLTNKTLTTPVITQINSSASATPTIFADSSGTQVGTLCRAWVNFNGTGTVAIRASFNVSSITDNGTGDYTINFTTAISDANYSAVGTGKDDGTGSYVPFITTQNTSSLRIGTKSQTTTSDSALVCFAVFR